MALTTKWEQGLNVMGVDEITLNTANKIVELSNGLSAKQFTDAIGIALEKVNEYSILSIQLVQKKDGEG